jgi:O-antigen/teichoic acid export membrane protein
VTPDDDILATGESDRFAGRFALAGRSLREHAARGTLVNAAFNIGMSFLGLIKGFVVAALLTRSEYGVWGVLLIGLGTLVWLKDVGVADRFVQQEEPDQRLAFQRAFTVELIFTGIFFVVLLVAVPVLALVYGRPELIAPGVVLAVAICAAVFQAPLWVFYRQMRFARQRTLQAIDPLVSFVATVALAVGGLGYWSLILGALAGTCASSVVAVALAPYPLALRYDRGTLRQYARFSWPLFVAAASSLVIAQGAMLAGTGFEGLAGAGAIALAATISQWTDRADAVITETLYPAICAVRDRTDLLLESFVKSNRLTLMWGMPFGVGLALFGADLVHFGLGDRWDKAIVLIQAFGLIAAFGHIGFNWDAYFRATGNTRPIAVVHVATAVAFLAAAVPLLAVDGLRGFGIGMGVVTVVNLIGRGWFLTRLFPAFVLAKHGLRAIAPTVPAVAVVLAVRSVEHVDRSVGVALAELALYLLVTAAATLAFERPLLREAVGYLRRSAGQVPATT